MWSSTCDLKQDELATASTISKCERKLNKQRSSLSPKIFNPKRRNSKKHSKLKDFPTTESPSSTNKKEKKRIHPKEANGKSELIPTSRKRSNSSVGEPTFITLKDQGAKDEKERPTRRRAVPRGLKMASMRSSPSSVVASHKNMIVHEKSSALSSKMVLSMNQQKDKKTAIFGKPLDSLMEQQNKEEFLSDIPLIVNWTAEHIRGRGIGSSGIFRESGHHSQQLKLQELLDEGRPREDLHFDDVDEHTVGALLRSFLRNLPDSIIPRYPFFPILVQVSAFSDAEFRLHSYRSLLRCLPRRNYALLKYLSFFLKDVAAQSHTNFMSFSNLALVFGPSFFGSIAADIKFRNEKMDPMFMFREVKFVSMLTEEILEEADFLFSPDATKAQAYRAKNHFPSPNGKYLSILRDDTFVVLNEESEEEFVTILMRESTGKISKEVLLHSNRIDLGEAKTRELLNLFGTGGRGSSIHRNSVAIKSALSTSIESPKEKRFLNQKRFSGVFKFNTSRRPANSP